MHASAKRPEPHLLPQLADIAPGWPFKLTTDDEHVYALLAHQGEPVEQVGFRWAVVVETNGNPKHFIGEMFKFARDTPVHMLRPAAKARFVVVG